MSSFTGRKRERVASSSVRRTERVARWAITAGGLGTVAAVVLICGFLIYVVVPLFYGGSAERQGAMLPVDAPSPVLAVGNDEYRLMTWLLERDGRLRVWKRKTGEPLAEHQLFEEGERASTWNIDPSGTRLVLGFEDGNAQVIDIWFDTRFLEGDEVPPELAEQPIGATQTQDDGVLERVGSQLVPQARFARMRVEKGKKFKAAGSAVRLIDRTITNDGDAFVTLSADDVLAVVRTEERENLMTGEVRLLVDRTPLPYKPQPGRKPPTFLGLNGEAIGVYLCWADGYAERYALASDEPVLAETLDLVRHPDGSVTTMRFLNGKTTIMVGDDRGIAHGWFPTRDESAGNIDQAVMREAHRLPGASGISALSGSRRSRLVAMGEREGLIRIANMTNNREVTRLQIESGKPILALSIAPKEDGIVAVTEDGIQHWKLDPGHHEASFGTLFGKTWYEGMVAPGYVWQSEGGSDDFEPKLSLMPLIFGTLKATLYSILIAAPIAFLAAIYTSEFLGSRAKALIKPTVEMMASLPSVVLGFLAALVIAPYVQAILPATMAALLTVPFVLLLGARLWQLLPTHLALKWARGPRLTMILLAFPIGILLARVVGSGLEGLFFGGDMMGWLSANQPRHVENVAGGWRFVLLPLSALIVGIFSVRVISPWVSKISLDWSRKKCALFDFGRFTAWLILSFGLAYVVGGLVGGFADTRGDLGVPESSGVMGQYSQRNALIVGFVMGFAVIPIIYTLAEDALSSVPRALREGSLGAGATPWQTASRIVIPTAMSGLFGALMVGLGRAVGETMVVLMATGSTPIMNWNMFSGFRTLSANIATELPEAPPGATHYRVLFLAALVLFAMTFLINVVAEIVRRIFRRRFAEL